MKRILLALDNTKQRLPVNQTGIVNGLQNEPLIVTQQEGGDFSARAQPARFFWGSV